MLLGIVAELEAEDAGPFELANAVVPRDADVAVAVVHLSRELGAEHARRQRHRLPVRREEHAHHCVVTARYADRTRARRPGQRPDWGRDDSACSIPGVLDEQIERPAALARQVKGVTARDHRVRRARHRPRGT